MICIYKLIHVKTSKYYIGSTVNLKKRLQVHMSVLKNNKGCKTLQSLYNLDKRFVVEIIEECRKSDLGAKEKMYLKKVVRIDPFCVNVCISGHRGARDIIREATENILRSISMLSKNGKHTRRRVVTLVSPTGQEYKCVNVSGFANTHRLHQSSLNKVATGKALHTNGWSLKGTNLTEAKNLPETVQRRFRKFVTVVNPEGKKIKVKNVDKFEESKGIKIVTTSGDRKNSIKSAYLDEYGRGWYIEGELNSYSFKHVDGIVINNIISPSTLARRMGVRPGTFRRLVNKKQENAKGWSLV